MAVRPYSTPGSAFTYDGENRLLTANVAGTGVTSFVYDGEGRNRQGDAAEVGRAYSQGIPMWDTRFLWLHMAGETACPPLN